MSTPTPRTDAAAGLPSNEWEETAQRLFEESIKIERELAREREKVRTLREACESICEEWGKNHDAPFCAGSNMEKLATAALAATEDAT